MRPTFTFCHCYIMQTLPLICPGCGEIVLARTTAEGTLAIPTHPDRVTPFVDCRVRVVTAPATRVRR